MSSEAIFWGTNHEHFALEAYKNNMIQNSHINVILSESGLVLSESILWLGCSPDELCYCDCCGTRLVEIKCPFKHRQNMQAEDLYYDKETGFTPSGSINVNHRYYAQVQTQMLITSIHTCGFVVWTPHLLLIYTTMRDQDFCNSFAKSSKLFFKYVILPELVTRRIGNSNVIVPPCSPST